MWDARLRVDVVRLAAHRRAWLEFADRKELREGALAGARRLDHRTPDAVEVLAESNHAAWTVLQYLPALDLEATPPLCENPGARCGADSRGVHRPAADDSRPYEELLDRVGSSAQCAALRWPAEHGCAAEAELTDAEAFVRAYQDSPDRRAMLEALEHLHRRDERAPS